MDLKFCMFEIKNKYIVSSFHAFQCRSMLLDMLAHSMCVLVLLGVVELKFVEIFRVIACIKLIYAMSHI